ncbi:hypothetical protein [Bifidobacterium mongoliense]|uniref:hypothetical protein n=1 Tax=Bifidobacterium mongoliense TaxID=518643 RepID=UPI00264A4CA9|nr:hypothetical protein [Bifidobacterium mongoliense]MDN6024641.1 hypothetical protein [Bifidobacterium mongoliense]
MKPIYLVNSIADNTGITIPDTIPQAIKRYETAIAWMKNTPDIDWQAIATTAGQGKPVNLTKQLQSILLAQPEAKNHFAYAAEENANDIIADHASELLATMVTTINTDFTELVKLHSTLGNLPTTADNFIVHGNDGARAWALISKYSPVFMNELRNDWVELYALIEGNRPDVSGLSWLNIDEDSLKRLDINANSRDLQAFTRTIETPWDALNKDIEPTFVDYDGYQARRATARDYENRVTAELKAQKLKERQRWMQG